MRRVLPLSLVVWLALAIPALAQNARDQKVRADKEKVEADGFWIYNDMEKGFAEAKKTGKPILVVLRCIPCVECVKLDDNLVDKDQRVRPLLDKYVCVRVVSTNGLDLSLFQYDYDQSFAGILLNADGTIYGRYGTRSDRIQWADDVSIEGLAEALKGGLELHAEYPKNKDILAAKRGPAATEFPSPEKYPRLKDKYAATINYQGNVGQSCIHCHQIGDAQRQVFRDRKQPIPEEMLFSYPHPKSQGLVLDPKTRATVIRALPDTPAGKAGFEPGDKILSLSGQPLLSMADVQWVLHHTPSAGKTLKAQVQRGEKKVDLELALLDGWRRTDEISWRASSWPLRRMGLGGMILEPVSAEDRAKLGLAKGMALRAKHVGQFGPHAAAKNAGFKVGDVIVSYDGKDDFQREADVLTYAVTARKIGETIGVTVLRDGAKVELKLPMQE